MPLTPRARLRPLSLVLLGTALVATGCGSGDDGGAGGGDADLTVVAGFYPLEYATQRVAGDTGAVEVVGLTSPGVDPHDLELTPRQVGTVQSADLVVLSGGMQAALDDAATSQATEHTLDVNDVVDLASTGDVEHGGEGDGDHAEGDHAGEDDHEGHDHGGVDPHFWLDPDRYSAAVGAIAEELAGLDPDHAEDYRANATAFQDELAALDEELAAGLADCRIDTVVTTHTAFGYLTDRYGLHQVGITGVSPDSEPSPARMAEITHVVQDAGVDTIYSEVLLGGDLAQVIADETGTEVLVLDPVEGITDASAGSDYLEVMRSNLEALRQGQDCS